MVVPFNLEIPVYDDVPRTYDGLHGLFQHLESRFAPGHLAEEIVFHHPDAPARQDQAQGLPRRAGKSR